MSIKNLTIHCSATPEGRDVKAKTVVEWGFQKFKQPSYHWVIELDGTAVRTLPDTRRGAHVSGNNTGNIGICYVGGMTADMKQIKDTRTPEQRKTMLTLVRTYMERFPGIKVGGHRDWSPDKNKNGKIESFEWIKGCPSFDVRTWLAENGHG